MVAPPATELVFCPKSPVYPSLPSFIICSPRISRKFIQRNSKKTIRWVHFSVALISHKDRFHYQDTRVKASSEIVVSFPRFFSVFLRYQDLMIEHDRALAIIQGMELNSISKVPWRCTDGSVQIWSMGAVALSEGSTLIWSEKTENM